MRFIARREGEDRPVSVERTGAGYRVTMGDRVIEAELVRGGPAMYVLRLDDGSQHLFLHDRNGEEYGISIGGRKIHVSIRDPLARSSRGEGDEHDGDGAIRAVMPGRVVRVLAAAGDEVKKGQGLLILEAMKMENELAAPRDGKVAEVHVGPGSTVESGAMLVSLEAKS